MGIETGIGWTNHTANFWMGCQRVSPGCEHCYAETLVTNRMGLKVWGPASTTERKRTASAWKDVPRWDRAARREGVRRKLFVSSLADIFEDHPQVAPWRAEALALLERCTNLDVQLLTKRPENIMRMVPEHWRGAWPAHVWIGTTVEDQRRAEDRIPHLLAVPARVRFLSCEPLLEAVDLPRLDIFSNDRWPKSLAGEPATYYDALRGEGLRPSWTGVSIETRGPAISWVIVGGESGPSARPFDLAWARSIVAQCREAGVPCFVKQVGARPVDSSRAAVHQPCIHQGRPAIRSQVYRADAPEVAQARADIALGTLRLSAPQVEHPLCLHSHFRYADKAGADPAEWPAELRVQQFPGVDR